jgi:uncharacterized coiled-coil DUF342 family protein
MEETAEKLIKLFRQYEELEKQIDSLKKELLPILRNVEEHEVQKLIKKYPKLKQYLK